MEPHNILKLLLVSLYLLISITSSRSHISSTASPDPHPNPFHKHSESDHSQDASPYLQPPKQSKFDLSPTASPGSQPHKRSISNLSPTPSPGPQPYTSHERSKSNLSPSASRIPKIGSSYKRIFHHPSLSPTNSDAAPSEAPITPNAQATSSQSEPNSISQNTFASSPLGDGTFHGVVNPHVKKICDSTDYPALCMATVVPHLKDKPDLHSILEVAIKSGIEFAKKGLSLAKVMANKPNIPPRLSSILKDCKDSFDTAVMDYESAISAFSTKDIGTMETMLSAVITDVSDCKDEFDEAGETDSPFSSFSEKLTNMTSNCLAIVSLMK